MKYDLKNLNSESILLILDAPFYKLLTLKRSTDSTMITQIYFPYFVCAEAMQAAFDGPAKPSHFSISTW
ncbi:hypothetical protein S2091_3826 [Solimicrobium silvestre]|uniref:Uncharacterized protein n=1 Tax=Solimicrobium silvestre TaxID=2099400 RepID=A0A2S9GUN3_9BURK|nr:hypothetical protein S2091_3826 [Solimicrobium silvestre]